MAQTEPSSSGGRRGRGSCGDNGGPAPIEPGYDPTPLLHLHHHLHYPPAVAGVSVSIAPFPLGAASTHWLMRPPSMAAGLRLEGRRGDWGYARPVVALDLVWNLAFVLVSCSVLASTARERPTAPLRVWILGYALHCLVHVGLVCFEYRRRQQRRRGDARWVQVGDDGDEGEEGGERLEGSRQSR